MIKNIIYQQLEERNGLLNHAYIKRIDVSAKTEYLSTGLIKLITGPRRSGKSVLSLQLLKNENFGLNDYLWVLSGILRKPGIFFSSLDAETSWFKPTGILLVSALFFTVASVISVMPQRPMISALILYINAIGMVLITAVLGYMVMVATQKKTVSFFKFYSI